MNASLAFIALYFIQQTKTLYVIFLCISQYYCKYRVYLAQNQTYMARRFLKFSPLPPLDGRTNNNGIQSSISRFSNELNSISQNHEVKEQGTKKQFKIRRNYVKERSITENNDVELRQFKDQIQRMKQSIQQRSLQKSNSINKKIAKLTQIAQNQSIYSQKPLRSSYNYISVQQPSQMPYFQPPPMVYPPYMPAPYYQPHPAPYQHYHHRLYDDRRERHSSNKRHQRLKKSYRDNLSETKDHSYYQLPKQKKISIQSTHNKLTRNSYFSKKITKKNIRKWKAIVWAIMFSKILGQLCVRIKNMRSSLMQRFQKRSFNTEMLLLQKYMVKKCKPFFLYLFNRPDVQLSLAQFETKRMEDQKVQAVKRLINMLIEGLTLIKLQDRNQPGLAPVEIIWLFCKHGTYSFNKYMSEQQLQMVAISENGYARMDKNIEKSQIINFVYSKILLYNTILHPQKVDKELYARNDENLMKNFYFIGSIWYELCMEVQDQYLCQVPIANYQLGNWKKFKHKFNIQPVQSLSLNGVMPDQDQMVTGLIGKQKIDEIFGVNFCRKQKNNLKLSVQKLHQQIVKYHENIKQTISF